MTCRCKRDNVDGQHLCHGQRYTCPQIGTRRLIATNACLAGTQPKVGVYETWACELCFAEFQALRGAKTADGCASLTGGAAVDTAASISVAALDEVDARGPALVDGDHADGFLVEIPRDGAGGALGLRVEVPAARGRRRGDQVDDDGGLALTFPEAARLDVRRGGEPDGDVLLHPACELRRVDGDGPACGRERPEAATDQQRRPAGGHEGPEGSGGTAATAAGHDPSVPDDRAALQRRAGRWPNRHWLYVEPQPDGRWLVEVSGLPPGIVMPAAFVPATEPPHNLHALIRPAEAPALFAAIGRAFLIVNGEV